MKKAAYKLFRHLNREIPLQTDSNIYIKTFEKYIQSGYQSLTDIEREYLNRRKPQNLIAKELRKILALKYDFAEKPHRRDQGFNMPDSWRQEINSRAKNTSIMMNYTRIISPTEDDEDFPIPIPWDFPDTRDRAIDSNSKETILIYTILLPVNASKSSIRSEAFSITEEIIKSYSEAIAVSIDNFVINGDDENKIEGITDNVKNITTVRVDNFLEKVISMQDRVKIPDDDACFFINSDIGRMITDHIEKHKLHNFAPGHFEIGKDGLPIRIGLNPVVYNEYMDNFENGNFPVIFGNLNKAYTLTANSNSSVVRIDNHTLSNQITYLAEINIGGRVTDPDYICLLRVESQQPEL